MYVSPYRKRFARDRSIDFLTFRIARSSSEHAGLRIRNGFSVTERLQDVCLISTASLHFLKSIKLVEKLKACTVCREGGWRPKGGKPGCV